jgi:hypothetical protein
VAAGGELDHDHSGRDLGRTPRASPAEAASAGGAEHGLAGGRNAGGKAKKKRKRAAQAKGQARASFQEQQPQWACAESIVLDEFGINLTMTRTYARTAGPAGG